MRTKAMKYHRVALATFILTLPVLLFVSCERAPEDTAEVRQAIEAINKQWEDAVKRGDAAAIAALYTEEARVLPQDGPTLVGREAIQNFQQSYIDAGFNDFRLTTLEVGVVRDLAYEIGEYALTIQPEEGEAIRDQGKYVVVWKRENGEWKLDVDIFNSSPPLPGE